MELGNAEQLSAPVFALTLCWKKKILRAFKLNLDERRALEMWTVWAVCSTEKTGGEL